MHPRRPGLHLFVHPITAAFAIDDADPFSKGIKDEAGLLADQGSLEGKEIGGIREDGVEGFMAKGFHGLINGGHLHHLCVVLESINQSCIALAGEDEDFRLGYFHGVPVRQGYTYGNGRRGRISMEKACPRPPKLRMSPTLSYVVGRILVLDSAVQMFLHVLV